MEAFRSFSVLHAVTLAAIGLAAWFTIARARGRPSTAPTRTERSIAWANLAIWTAVHVWWILPPQLDLKITLPLHLCHLTSLIASAVLLTRARLLYTLQYFWGFGLCTQGLVTPNLVVGPASFEFWAFWQQHAMVLITAVYVVAVRGYRPQWRDYRQACAAVAIYAALMLALDMALGANYGFVGDSTPGQPSVVDLLGPWPQRLVVIVALVAAMFALLMLPWRHTVARKPA